MLSFITRFVVKSRKWKTKKQLLPPRIYKREGEEKTPDSDELKEGRPIRRACGRGNKDEEKDEVKRKNG